MSESRGCSAPTSGAKRRALLGGRGAALYGGGLSARFGAILLAGACACTCQSRPSAPPRAAVPFVEPAWLVDRLPRETVAYVRVPTLLGVLAAPSGRALDPALGSEANARVVEALREALVKDELLATSALAPLLRLAVADLRSPIELAVLDEAGELKAESSLGLLTAGLAFDSVEALNARFVAVTSPAPLLAGPLDASGKGRLAGGDPVRFDARARRLYALVDVSPRAALPPDAAERLERLIAAAESASAQPHPARELERRVDASGHGLFGWVRLKGLATQVLPRGAQGTDGGTLLADLGSRAESLAFGWGTVGARGRLQVRLDAPGAELLASLGPAAFRGDLRTAGRPSWAMTVRLPTAKGLAELESAWLGALDDELASGAREGLAKLETFLGAPAREVLGLFGPELVAFEDANGRFAAVRVDDRPAAAARLKTLVERLGATLERLEVDGVEIAHLAVPGAAAQLEQAERRGQLDGGSGAGDERGAAGAQPPELAALLRVKSHFYWVESGSWIVLAEVPQALADRTKSTLDTELGAWLAQIQGYPADRALVGATGVTRHAHRDMYHAYLASLQTVGDLLGARVPLAAMPRAGSLGLPVEGAIGFAVEASPEHLGLSLTYEQSPAEALVAVQGPLIAGALAAGALAASGTSGPGLSVLRDYRVRQQVSAVLEAAAPLKVAVQSYFMEHSELPSDEDELEGPFRLRGDGARYVERASLLGGAIVLELRTGDGDEPLDGRTLVLTPHRGPLGILVWVCGHASPPARTRPLLEEAPAETTVPRAYLPSECR